MWEDAVRIHLHNRNISSNNTDRRNRIRLEEMAGLELLVQQGIMKQAVINRLKELAEKMK